MSSSASDNPERKETRDTESSQSVEEAQNSVTISPADPNVALGSGWGVSADTGKSTQVGSFPDVSVFTVLDHLLLLFFPFRMTHQTDGEELMEGMS